MGRKDGWKDGIWILCVALRYLTWLSQGLLVIVLGYHAKLIGYRLCLASGSIHDLRIVSMPLYRSLAVSVLCIPLTSSWSPHAFLIYMQIQKGHALTS